MSDIIKGDYAVAHSVPVATLEIPTRSILLEAEGIINGDRKAAYGAPEANFGRWADLCRASGRESIKNLTGADLAMVMVLGKLSRETNSHKRDNLVDAAGYLDLYRQLLEAE